jgi:hypothetical protein
MIMPSRSVIWIFLAALTGCFINGNGQIQGDARDNGSGNAANNGSNNGNGASNGSGNPTKAGAEAGAAAVNADGAWDITASVADPVVRSEMSIKGGKATGIVVFGTEGQLDPGMYRCVRTKDRYEFELTANGDSMAGTFTIVRAWASQSNSYCREASKRVFTVIGQRTAAGKSDLDGEWRVSSVGPGTETGSEGLTASLSVSIAEGFISAVASRADLSFAARKR